MHVRAEFEDGPADLHLDRALYGVTNGREWALLQPLAADQPSGGRHATAVHIIDDDDDDDDNANDDDDQMGGTHSESGDV